MPDEKPFDIASLVPEDGNTLNDVLTKFVRKAWRPKIHKLQDAIVDGKLIVQPGERVLIEYGNDEGRDTTQWIVVRVFDTDESVEGRTVQKGHVRLWDPEKTQYGSTNYLQAKEHGLVFKVPDKSRRWMPGDTETLMEQVKKRKRRRKKGSAEEPEETPKKADDAKPEGKRRGRPRGSKNKSTLEKEAKAKKEPK